MAWAWMAVEGCEPPRPRWWWSRWTGVGRCRRCGRLIYRIPRGPWFHVRRVAAVEPPGSCHE